MNAVGNDNYKPGLKPPEPIRQRAGWLSSNMAQLMVFLNGLILTITAFATLSVFIDEIIQDNFKQTTEEVEQFISERYQDTERSLQALSSIISMPNDVYIKQLSDYVAEESSGTDNFEQIYWVQKLSTDQWNAASLKEGTDFTLNYGSTREFVNFVQRAASAKGNKNIRVITSVPNDSFSAQDEAEQVMDKLFLVIETIRTEGREGYVVGISRFSHILEKSWLEKKLAIYDMQIIDTQSSMPLFSYRKSLDGNQNNSFIQSMNFTPKSFSKFPVEVVLNLSMDSREAFLQKIPLLMLLFGITLTLIGTLYVRNNQTQSQKLAEMNKELAHKNFELNQEMSERERLNQVIQKSARENRAVVNAVSDIIFEIAIDGTILFLNEAWKKVTAFELERSIGRNIFDLIYSQDQEEQKENLDLLVKGQKNTYRAFTRLRTADGQFRAVELAVSMMRQDENKDLRVVGTITDVEERRRAERALSETEKKYRAIVENAAGGIYQVTPEGYFLSANPAFAKILGFDKPEEVLRDIENSHSQVYVEQEQREAFLQKLSILDHAEIYESQIYTRDGNLIWVRENIRPVKDDEGNLLFYEGSMEDVDQRRKAEIALREAKIQSDLANRAKSEFLANMSHELRTPLNSVIGFSEIIKNEAFGVIAQTEYKEYATNIHESGNKLLKVINEILDVSRIEAGNRTLNEKLMSVSEAVSSSVELMESKIKSAGIRVENKTKNLDINFIGELQAVKQMLLNLLSNAVKFSPENSLIMLDAEIDSSERLRISVTDTGMGLTEDELQKALSPFGQIETELNRASSGTGLGLTLVKSLVELHGGALEMVSQKGIGTTATLIFPAKRVAKSPSKAQDVQAKDIKSAEVKSDPRNPPMFQNEEDNILKTDT